MPELPAWLWNVLTTGGTIAVPLLTVLAWLRKHIQKLDDYEHRIACLEGDAKKSTERDDDTLQQFRADLKKHQEEDCERLEAIQDQSAEIKQMVSDTANDVKWIKETKEKDDEVTNRRITEHDKRNREHADKLAAAVSELNSAVAVLKDKSPKPRTR